VRALTTTEQIAVERIGVQLPATRDGKQPAVEAFADVVVALAPENEPDLGLMWCFRGPGMIIERRDLRKISLAARPFRALLVCGEALRDRPAHRTALEVFLKTAEPPAHDRWVATPRLRERYKNGWKVALQRLMTAADEAVRRHVAVASETSDGGPEKLRRLFKVGSVGGGRAESEFHFRDLRAEVIGGAWHFHARVLPNLPTASAWSTVVDVEFPEERGRGHTSGTIAAVKVEGASHELVDGRVRITAPPGTEFVDVSGRTDPARHPVGVREAAIELVILSRAEDDR
jgi:RNA polymerase primary sigma factor